MWTSVSWSFHIKIAERRARFYCHAGMTIYSLLSVFMIYLMFVINPVGLGTSFGPTTRWKENVRKSHMLLEERPGSGLQLTAVISKGAHIKSPILALESHPN